MTMRKKSGVLATLLVGASLLCGVRFAAIGFQQEKVDGADAFEPNNARDKATVLPVDKEIQATIFPRGDQDHYHFTLNHAARVTIKLTGPSPVLCLQGRLLDEQGRLIVDRTAGPGRDLQLVADLRAGKYFLEMRDGPHDEFDQARWYDGGESRTPYRLLVSADRAPDSFEPNDDPAKAPALELARAQSVWIFPAGDRDCFRLKVPEPGIGELRITATGVTENISLYASVTHPGGRNESLQAPLGKPLFWPVRIGKGGDYVLALESGSYWQDKVYKGHGSDGSLQPIQLKVEFLDAGDSFEPNNDLAQAAPLPLAKDVSATLYPAGDVDHYKVAIPEGKRGWLRVDLAGLPDSIHPHLVLLDKDRRTLREVGRERGQSLSLIHGLVGGDYFLTVRDRGLHNGWFHESWDDTGSRVRYQLRAEFHTTTVDEREPNDRFEQAEEITLGTSRTGTLAPEEDRDHFKFTLKEGDPDLVQIVVSDLHSRLYSRLSLYTDKQVHILSSRLQREGYHVLNARLGPGSYFFVLATETAHNGVYHEFSSTQFQSRPYRVSLLPLYQSTLVVDRTPHHLGDRKLDYFAKPEPEGLTFSTRAKIADPGEYDVVAINSRYIRRDLPPELSTYLEINGKEVAALNPQVVDGDAQWRTMLIDVPAGVLKSGENEITLRTRKVENQGTDNWEFRSIAMGKRLYYAGPAVAAQKSPIAVPRTALDRVPLEEGKARTVNLVPGKWHEFRLDRAQPSRWFAADLAARGYLRFLLPGPHLEAEPQGTLYRVQGDLTKPWPRVLYLRGRQDRSRLDEYFPEILFTRIEAAAKEAPGALLDLQALLGYDAIILDGLADVSNFDFGGEKAQANLRKYAEAGKRVLVLDPCCSLEKVGVKLVGIGEGNQDRTIELPTKDALFAGQRGSSVGWPGAENGCRIDNWQQAGLVRLAADLLEPDRAVTAYLPVGKGAIVYETMLLGHPYNQPHARPRLQWLLGLTTRLEHLGQLADAHDGFHREGSKLWTSPILTPGKYLLGIQGKGQQNATAAPMLLWADFIPSEHVPGGPGSNFTQARAVDIADQRLVVTGKIDEHDREQWYRLKTTGQKGASIRLECPEELDLAIDLYRGQPRPTGKRVLYLHGRYENHDLAKYFPDITWERREWNAPHAQRVLLDPAELRGYDAVIVDAMHTPEQFGLSSQPVQKSIEEYVRGGGRFIVLSPVCAMEGFGIKSENPGRGSQGKTVYIGEQRDLLKPFLDRGVTVDFPSRFEDEIGAFSSWQEAGYTPLFRHADNIEKWASAVYKKVGQGYYFIDCQRIGGEDVRGPADWKVYFYLGVTPTWQFLRTIDNTFGRSFGGPEQFDLPWQEFLTPATFPVAHQADTTETDWYLRVVDRGQCHRSSEPFTLILDPVLSPSAGEHNDTRDTTTPLPLGKTVQGKLFPAGDRDVYRLEVNGPGLLRVSLDHPADNIDAELTLVSKDVSLKKVLYLQGGRADYNIFRRRLAGVEFTYADPGRVLSFSDLAPNAAGTGFDAIILDGLTNPTHYGIGLEKTQQDILRYVENGGIFILLCPQLADPKEIRFWGAQLVSGWKNDNIVVVDAKHPLHHRRASGSLGGWEYSETHGHFIGWKEAGFNLVYADQADKEKNATLAVKTVGKGMLILNALEVGYPSHADVSLWHLANLLDAPPEVILDATSKNRPGTPRFDERIVAAGTYYLTVRDNAVLHNFVNASPVPYNLRAEFLAIPELDAVQGAQPQVGGQKQEAQVEGQGPLAADVVSGLPANVLLWPAGKSIWYRFANPSPGRITLALTNVPDSVDPVLDIYRGSDLAKPWKQVNGSTGKSHGGPEFVQFETATSETYYVKVYDKEGVRSSLQSMRLQMDFAAVDCPFEPSNDAASALPLVPGYAYRTNIFPARDSDWFRFTVAEKSKVEIVCSEVPADLAVRVQIFSADNLKQPLQEIDGKRGAKVELKAELAKAGTYLLVLRGGADGAPSPETFQLQATYQPAAPLPALAVLSQWPTPDLAGTFPDAPIKVAFNRPIKGDGVDKAITVAGSKSGPIAGKVELDAKTQILSFRSTAGFAPGEKVSVTLAGVNDLNGKELAAVPPWSFSIGTPRIAETIVSVALPRRKLGAGKHAVVASTLLPLPVAPSVGIRLSDGTLASVAELARKEDGKWHGLFEVTAATANGPARIEVIGKDSLGRKVQRVSGDIVIEIDTVAPPAMPALVLEQRPQGKMALTWTPPRDVADLAGYRLFRALEDRTPADKAQMIAEVTNPQASFFEDQPAADGTYFYAIAAVDEAGNLGPVSAYSRGVSVRSGPKLLVQDFASKVEKGRVILSWRKSAEAGVVGYNLHRFGRKDEIDKLDAARPYRRLGMDEQLTVDLPADGDYFYVLAARDAAGNIGPLASLPRLVVDTQPARCVITTAQKPPLVAGEHLLAIKVSEKLKGPPGLKVRMPRVGDKEDVRVLAVKAIDDFNYQAVLKLTKDDPDGDLFLILEGEDQYGNKGLHIDNGPYLAFDNAPPRIRVYTDPPGRFKAGPVRVVVDFSEPLVGEPRFAYKVAGKTFPLALKKEREQRYSGIMELGRELPNGPAQFDIVATDRFQHTGGIFEQGQDFFIKTNPPGPATGLKVAAAREASVQVRWSPPAGETVDYFRVYAGEAADFAVGPKTLVQDGIRDIQFLLKTKTDRALFVRVTAVDAAGNESAPTAAVRAEPDSTPPAEPTDLIAQVQKDGQVKLTWKKDAVKEEVRFLIFRTTEEKADLARLTPAATKDLFHVEKPPASGEFFYHVVAEDLAGNWSKPARARLAYDLEPPRATVVLAPAQRPMSYYDGAFWKFDVVNAGKIGVQLKFNEPLLEAPQLRYRTKTLDAPRDVILTQKGEEYFGEIDIAARKEDGLAHFLVTAKDRAGNVGHGFVAGERFWIDTTAPEPPGKVAAEKLPLGKVALSWSVPVGEHADHLRYHLYRSPKSIVSVAGLKPLIVLERDIRFVDSPAEEGDYFYVVVAEDLAGHRSPLSAEVSTRSDTTPPPTPTALSATMDRQVRLSWQPPAEKGVRYRVYRSTSPEVVQVKNRIAETNETGVRDLPQTDGTFHYGVTAVDASGNESPPSNIVKLDFAGKVPRATISTDPRGRVRSAFKLTMTTSLPLVETPQLFLQAGQRSDAIVLRRSDAAGSKWEGNFDVPSDYPNGTASFSFRGVAAEGFVGTTIDAGGELTVDTQPPAARIALSRPSPLPAGAHEVIVTTSEPLAATPKLLLTTLGARPRIIELQPKAVAPEKGDSVFRGTFTVTREDRDGRAVFTFQGSDLAGNEGLIENLEPFDIDHHSPKPPTGLLTRSMPGGGIELTWQAPLYQAHEVFDQIAGYNVYRVPLSPTKDMKDLTPILTGVRSLQVVDQPDKDGDYFYLVATLDASGLLSEPGGPMKGRSDRTPPLPPRLVEVKQLPTGIGLVWDSDEDTKDLRYRVLAWAEGRRDPIEVIKDTRERKAEYRPLVSGTYLLRITATDEVGNESAQSIPHSFVYRQLAPVARLSFSRPPPWGEGPLQVNLAVNRPLTTAPRLALVIGEKPVPLEVAGVDMQWVAKLNVNRTMIPATVLPDERGWVPGEFRFQAVVKEQDMDLEGTGIIEGREAQFDFTPPTAALDFGPLAAHKDKLVLLRAGKYDITLTASEPLKESPRLTFTPQNKDSQVLTLETMSPGETRWRTVLTVDTSMEGPGLFEFQGVDPQGNVGKEISQGRNVVMRTRGPGIVGKLRAVSLPGGRVRLDWTPPLLASGEADTSANRFRLFRGDSKMRSIEGMTPLAEIHRTLGFMDFLQVDREVFYTVAAVDEAGNVGEPAVPVSVHVDRTPPGPPRDLVVSELPSGAVKLTWKAPLGESAAYYRVYLEKFPIRSVRGLRPQNDVIPFTEVYGTPNDNGKYYFAVTAVDQALNESEPGNVVFLDYKSIAPMAFFHLVAGAPRSDAEVQESSFGTLNVTTAVALSQPPRLEVKGPKGEPRRLTLVGDGKNWSARIAPAALFPLTADGKGADIETHFTLELTTVENTPTPRVFFHPQSGDARAIAFVGEGKQFTASLLPREFFRIDPRIWLTDGAYTVNLWTTVPLREAPRVMVHSEARPPRPLGFTGSGNFWQARLDIDRSLAEGQYGFQFEGTDVQGNVGTEVREGPLFRIDRQPPLPPEKLQATAEDQTGAVRVQWSPPQKGGAEIAHFYRIYRSKAEFADRRDAELVRQFRVEFEGKDAESLLDVPPENGTWYYRVTALDLARNESAPSGLARVTVSTKTPHAQIRLHTPYSGDAAASRVGKTGARVVLSTNVPLKEAPKLEWSRKSKPGEKFMVPLAGSETRFEGELRLPDAILALKGEGSELEEEADFAFAGTSAEGIESRAIRSGRSFTVDTVGPEARIIIPAIYEMKITAKVGGGGELKIPPVRAGRTKVDVELREPASDVPELRYTLDDGQAIAVPLTGFGRNWSGWMDIPADIAHARGKFLFKASDLAGNVSTKITRREYPREVDETSFPPITLRNFATTGGEFEVDSLPPAPPTSVVLAARKLGVAEIRWEAPGAASHSSQGNDGNDVWTYRLYRSLTPLVGKAPDTSQRSDILARVMVDDPPVDGTYFYAVTAVDLAGNESVLSECPSIFLDTIKSELKIKAVPEGDDFVILFPEEEPMTAEVTLRFPGQKEFKVSLGGESGQLKKVMRQVNGRPVPGYVMPRRAEFFNGKVEVIVHSPDPAGNQVEAITETAYRKITAAVGGEVESSDGAARLEIPAGLVPVIPKGPKEYKRVGGYDALFFLSYERIADNASEAQRAADPRVPDPVPPGLDVIGTPYTIHLNDAPREPISLRASATQADLSQLKALMPKLTMRIPDTYSDAVKDPDYLKTRLKVIKWVPTPGGEGKRRGHWEMVPDIEIKSETQELIAPADSITTYVIVSERTPPAILDATPEPNSSTRSLRPALSARIVDKGTGVAMGAENPIFLTIDGQKVPLQAANLTSDDPTEVRLSYQPPGDLKPGVHLLALRAEDVVGNVAHYQWRFTIDDQAPVIGAIQPAEGAVTAVARPIMSAQLSDEGGIAADKLRLQLDGVEMASTDLRYDEATGAFAFAPTTDLAAGEHTVQLTVHDRTGQVTNRSWKFIIDHEPPMIEAPEILTGNLLARVRDQLSALDETSVRLLVNGQPIHRGGDQGFTWQAAEHSLTYRLPSEPGKMQIQVTVLAQDVWGNYRQGNWLVKEGEPAIAVDAAGNRLSTPPRVAQEPRQKDAEVPPKQPEKTEVEEAPKPGGPFWIVGLGILILLVALVGLILWRKRPATA